MLLTQAQHNIIMNQINQWIQQDARGFNWGMPNGQAWESLGGANMRGVKAIYVHNALGPNPSPWHIAINLPPKLTCVAYAQNLNNTHRQIANFTIDAGTSISRVNITFTNQGLKNLSQSLGQLEDHIRCSLRLRNNKDNGMVFGRCPGNCPGYHGTNPNPNHAHP
jgi:hypothetical protein